MNKISGIGAGFLLIATILGCSSNISTSEFSELSQQAPINLTAQSADSSLPIFVSFNNDYKGNISDNEPIARGDVKNPDKYFLSLINSAQTSLDGSFYDIQDPGVVEALIQAKQRGVIVRLITDDANLKDKVDPTQPRQAIADLKNAGIPVKDDHRSKLMHNKFMIIDSTYVWTGSMNLTTSSMYHHNNNSVRIKSTQLAANFQAEFNRLFEQGIFDVNSHKIPYPTVNVSGATIRTYFSPGGGTMDAIVTELKKAQKSIKFMAFSMTDKNILAAMVQKKQAGLKVEGVFDNCLIPQYSIYWDLKKAKILTLRDGNQALMHHKVMIIDDETVVTGSFNFSKSADQSNNENAIIIKSSAIAKQFNAEYNKVRNAAFYNKNLPKYDHPACQKEEDRNKEPEKPTIPPSTTEVIEE